MCGIFGFVGRSLNPKATYALAHSLFLKTEVRGTDATGFYALEPEDGRVIYDKEDVKSSDYVKKDVWSSFADIDVDLFIGHCRQTSLGGGPEKINKNNHPHVSDDRRLAMVHNGKIPEFSALKNKYDVDSDCDSEILLRMFESAGMIAAGKEDELKKEFPTLNPFLAVRVLGMKEIFSRVNYGAMAVAIAERGDDGNRYLWLFRDEDRPLHVIDMRSTLGQIFFCSTTEIWRQAVDMTPEIKQYIPADQVIMEFPAYQTWLLGWDENDQANPKKPWNIRKFKITKTKQIDWDAGAEAEEEKLVFKRTASQKKPVELVCRLGANEEIVKEEKKEVTPPALPGMAPDVKKNVSESIILGATPID